MRNGLATRILCRRRKPCAVPGAESRPKRSDILICDFCMHAGCAVVDRQLTNLMMGDD